MKSLALIAGAAWLLTAPAACPAEAIKVGGTGTAMRAMQILGEAYRAGTPETSVVVLFGLGSRGGQAALRSGAIQLAVSADPLAEEDRRSGLSALVWLRTAMVFAVSRSVPVSGLTSAELPRIYAGEITTWSDGSPLRLVLRPPGDSDTRQLKGLSPAMSAAVDRALQRAGLTMAATDQDAAEAIETIPGALGGSTLGLLLSERRRVRVLSVDGVAPTVAAVTDGSYPYTKTLHLVYRTDASPATRRFVAFATSAAARSILAPLGFQIVPSAHPAG